MSVTKTNRQILFTLLDELKAKSLSGGTGTSYRGKKLQAFIDGVIHIAELLDIASTVEIRTYIAHGIPEGEDRCHGKEAVPSSRPTSGPNLKNRLIEWAKANGTVVGEPAKTGYGVGRRKKRRKKQEHLLPQLLKKMAKHCHLKNLSSRDSYAKAR